jgi:GNAT superfamily N-acetyltransferase
MNVGFNCFEVIFMTIVKATQNDLPEIFDLQKLAYLSEAKLLNYYLIQPLTQTLDEVEQEFSKGIILKMIDEKIDKIIGSVRAYEENDRVYVGKLFVHPDYQNKGFGTKLLKEIEIYYTNKTFELFTTSKSLKNIALYLKNEYKEFKRKRITDDLEFIYLEK